jgi:hypothetical protein
MRYARAVMTTLRKIRGEKGRYSNYEPLECDQTPHPCGGSRNTVHISLISVDSVRADRVVAETEVVGRGSVIRWVCHGHAALLVHHPAFLGSAFTLPATELLPTVSAYCHKEKIRSRFGHSPHLSPSLHYCLAPATSALQ